MHPGKLTPVRCCGCRPHAHIVCSNLSLYIECRTELVLIVGDSFQVSPRTIYSHLGASLTAHHHVWALEDRS